MKVLVQAKGQVTIPKAARDKLGLGPGSEAIWIENAQGHWEIRTFEDLLDDLAPDLEAIGEWSRRVKKGYNPKRG